MDFNWILEGKLAASEAPRSHRDLEFVKKLGIKAILNLLTYTEMFIYDDTYQEMGFDYLNMPIEDMHAPSIEELKIMVKWIDKKIKENKPVLVHCYAGLGRTGTVIAGYLIYKGYTPDEAIRYVRGKRPGSIQTLQQEITLHIFNDALKKEKTQK